MDISLKTVRNSLAFVAITLFLLVGCSDTALAQCTAQICASPATLTFTGQAGAASSIPSQPIMLTTSAGAAQFGVSINSAADWLQVDLLIGTAPVTINASVKPGANSLTAGTYPATITIAANSGPPVMINANLVLTGTGGGTSALSAIPNPVVFNNVPAGTVPATLTLSLSNSGATTAVAITSNASWLSATPTPITVAPGTPVSITLTANPTGLAVGTYSGNLTFTPSTGTALVVPVTLNVGVTGGTGAFSVSPNPIPTFTFASGATIPSSQALVVTATTAAVTVTATSSTTTGGSWLTVNPPTAQTVTPGVPFTFTVSANPAGLQPGNYQGSVTITPQGGGAAVTVPVTLTITGAPSIVLGPASFSFAYQTSTASPPAQFLTIGSTGAAIQWFLTATTETGGNWLVVTPANGQTSAAGGPPSTVPVQVNPSGLAPGTYKGTISVMSSGAVNSPQTVPVTLLVSTQPILTFENSGTMFTYQLTGPGLPQTLPPAQTVQITSSGNPLPISVSTTPVTGGNFLNVTPTTGTTPQRLSFTLNPGVVAGLAPGTYTETVTVTSPTAGNSPQNYTVTLVVTNTTLLIPSQSALSFNYQVGQAQPLIQTIGVTSTGAPLNYTVTTATNTPTSQVCANFLSAAPPSGTTSGNVAVSVSTAGLPAGTCTGTVSISSPGAGNSPVNIPVTLFVSSSPLLNVSPSAVNVSATVGANPANQTVSLTSTDAATPLPFTVTSTTTTGGPGWLLVGPTSGSTPANLNVGFNTAGLTVGTYTGSITVSATGPANSPVVVPVSVVIAPTATASATPSSLTFTQAFGAPAPAAQMIVINSTTTGLTFAATATTFNGGAWLSVTPTGGSTSASVTVTANGTGLAPGSYSGVITFQVPGAANTPVSVPVTLTVGPAQSFMISSTTVSFSSPAGATTPPQAQTLQLASSGGNVPFTATASTVNGLNLFTITPASGTTPSPLAIGLNQTALATLAPGNYMGTITIASPAIPGGNQTINVALTVTAQAPPTITAIVNGASLQPGAVSPGEIVTIFGSGLGPAAPGVGLALTPQGMVSTSLGNTMVTFDGIPAPLIFVRADQINAIVPYEIAGRVNTTAVVQRSGQSSAGLQVRVVDTAPEIFSLSQTGSGQGAILNFNSTVNGPANPAPKGTAIVIYATGEGSPTPPVATGSVTGLTPPFPSVPNVSVTIGGLPAVLQYTGEAPGLVSGVLQVNAVVPQNIGSGPQTVVLTVGGASNNQQTITVMIQ